MPFSLLTRTCKECGNLYKFSITNEFMTYKYCSKRCITQVEKANNELEAKQMVERVAQGTSLFTRIMGIPKKLLGFGKKDKATETNSENASRPRPIPTEEDDYKKFSELLDILAIKEQELQILGRKIIDSKKKSPTAKTQNPKKFKWFSFKGLLYIVLGLFILLVIISLLFGE